MQRARHVPWLAALTFTVCGAAPALAHHTVFSASVDRFEIDGNAFGPADGVPDQVDEFDDGTIAPNWTVLLGTAVESGGVLTLENPGVDITLVPGALLDISNVENTTDVANGEGDFTATSYWTPAPLGLNTQIHFQLYGLGSIVEAAGLTLANLGPGAGPGGPPPGYSISQEVTFILGPGGVPQQDTVAIDPADITGPIVLRMAFDDATDTMRCTFSLDGGATFQSPFPPLHVFQVVQSAEILLGANSIAAVGSPPPPPTGPQVPVATKILLVKDSSTPAGRKVIYQAKDTGVFLGGSPPLYGATLNMTVGATNQCFHLPKNFWHFVHSGYLYRDSQGIFGPVKLLKVRATGPGRFTIKAIIVGKLGQLDIVPPNGPAYGDVNLHLNGLTAATEYCGSTLGGLVELNDAKTFKVKSAPAPAACTLAACSPSAAFLDDTGPF